jgi:hypothetical protein
MGFPISIVLSFQFNTNPIVRSLKNKNANMQRYFQEKKRLRNLFLFQAYRMRFLHLNLHISFPGNMGAHRSINKILLSNGELHIILINKAAKERKGDRAEDVIRRWTSYPRRCLMP